MTATIILGIGLEYIDTVFQTIQNSNFSQYTIAGMKTLAVLFFLVNILKKYNEGIADKDGYTWGLSPGELGQEFCHCHFGHILDTGVRLFRWYLGCYRRTISRDCTCLIAFTNAGYSIRGRCKSL